MNARFAKFSVDRKVLLGWVMKTNLREEEHWNHVVNHYQEFHPIILFTIMGSLILRNFSALKLEFIYMYTHTQQKV